MGFLSMDAACFARALLSLRAPRARALTLSLFSAAVLALFVLRMPRAFNARASKRHHQQRASLIFLRTALRALLLHCLTHCAFCARLLAFHFLFRAHLFLLSLRIVLLYIYIYILSCGSCAAPLARHSCMYITYTLFFFLCVSSGFLHTLTLLFLFFHYILSAFSWVGSFTFSVFLFMVQHLAFLSSVSSQDDNINM